MSNASQTSNTVSSTVVFIDKGGGECIDDAIVAELIRRLQGTITLTDPSNIVRSVSAPSDVTKIWYQENAAGQVIDTKYYDSLTGQWVTVPTTLSFEQALCSDNNAIIREADGCIRVPADSILTISTSSSNLITRDSDGALIVEESTIRDKAVQIDLEERCNILNKDSSTFALSVPRGAHFMQDVGATGTILQGHIVSENDPDDQVRTLDLTTIPNVNWNSDCPPSHVQVTGIISIKAGSGFSGGTWAAPAVQISAGVDMTRVVSQVDADSTEGTSYSSTILRLDPTNPENFTYRVADISGTSWTDAKNELALVINSLVWTSEPPA